jgi:hypothetical protein
MDAPTILDDMTARVCPRRDPSGALTCERDAGHDGPCGAFLPIVRRRAPVLWGEGAPAVRTHPDICMASGEPVWFLYPERTTVRPADLRAHLARVCRYNGALPWTDLQHLALCCEISARGYVADALPYVAAHDLHEAVVGDLPTHLKKLLPGWKAIEDGWEAHVHRSLGLAWPVPEDIRVTVKQIDRIALCVEMDGLGHVMAAGCAERRGVVVTEEMRSAFRAISRLTDDGCWRVLCRALPALGEG